MKGTLREIISHHFIQSTPETLVKQAAWCQRCAPGNWLIKREPGVEATSSEPAIEVYSHQCPARRNVLSTVLVQVTLQTLEKKAAAWCQRCAPGNWLIKREEEAFI